MKNYDQDIIKAKKVLRNKSKNYKENFKKIEEFIAKEVQEIKKKNSSIIPEINFRDLGKSNNTKIVDNIKKKSCLVIRDVIDDKTI